MGDFRLEKDLKKVRFWPPGFNQALLRGPFWAKNGHFWPFLGFSGIFLGALDGGPFWAPGAPDPEKAPELSKSADFGGPKWGICENRDFRRNSVLKVCLISRMDGNMMWVAASP